MERERHGPLGEYNRRDMTREQDAQRNLAKALAAAGADFIGTAELRPDGYALTFSRPSKFLYRSGIAAAVLENAGSPALVTLIEEIHRQMD